MSKAQMRVLAIFVWLMGLLLVHSIGCRDRDTETRVAAWLLCAVAITCSVEAVE